MARTTVMGLELTWPEVERAIQSKAPVFLPVGSVEQHGPHLPLGVDGYIPLALAEIVAGRVGSVVAPPISYAGRSAPRSGGGEHFPGTTCLRGQTLQAVLQDILGSFARQGWRGACVLNGHFENGAFIAEAALDLHRTGTRPEFKVCVINWWELVSPALLRELFGEQFPGWELEHASLTETSLMRHFHPGLVHLEAIPPWDGVAPASHPYAVFPEPPGLVPPSGILYRADTSSAEIGRRLADHLVEAIEGIVKREFGL